MCPPFCVTMGGMRIAILGGAFDPPHIGHYLVARQVKELLRMDEVWFMVCHSYFPEFPDKLMRITGYEDRYHMASFLNDGGLAVSDFEHVYNKRSRTIDTLRLLKEKRPADTFHWVIGSDTLPTFHLWNEWRELVHDNNLIVFPRDTNFVTLEQRVRDAFKIKVIPENITVVEGNLIVSNIASTQIRERIKHKLPVSSFVKSQVEEYIKSHNLYA